MKGSGPWLPLLFDLSASVTVAADPAWDPSQEDSEEKANDAECVANLPAESRFRLIDADRICKKEGTNVRRLTLLLALSAVCVCLFAGTADAAGQLKAHCDVYAQNRVDPIAHSEHRHRHFGNTSTTHGSTGESLMANGETSCQEDWFTSAGWFPVERKTDVIKVAVYYRAPGDQRQIREIPSGLQLLANEEQFNCAATAGTGFSERPPYRCRGNWNTRVTFPDCWNEDSLDESTLVNSRSGVCPSSHPYRIPKINYLIRHSGPVPKPIRVSAGVAAWHDYTFMHGDYFAANQPEFNDELLDLCLRDVADSTPLRALDERCGADA